MFWFNAAHCEVYLACQEDPLLTCVIKSPSPFLQSCYLASHSPPCSGACSYFCSDECTVYPIVQMTDKGVKLPVLIPEVVHC